MVVRDPQETTSLWMTAVAVPATGELTCDDDAEVCVVGAGISGLTTAYLLACEGKRVVVLDEGAVGGGETCRTTAHLSNAIDNRYFEIERLHGQEGAALAAQSHTSAIELIESICRREQIDCDLMRLDGYLFTPEGESSDLLERELLAAHRAGLRTVKRLEYMPLLGLSSGPCLRFPRQAQFHPMRYLAGLARAFMRRGGRIFLGARVVDVRGGQPALVTTEGGQKVTAAAVVMATNSPGIDRFVINTKQTAYRTYVVGLRIPPLTVPLALYWDTLDPYHYVRIHKEGSEEFLIVGGEDHRTGQSRDERECLSRLEAWARARFSSAGETAYRWSGQIEETVDGLAYIGRNPLDAGNVYVATGDSGMGMTHGTIAGRLITDLIIGRPNRWAELYDPSRKTLRSLPTWLSENTNTIAQYGDYFTQGDLDSIDDLERGQGAIIRNGLRKVAAYRDDFGALHQLSAVCPHLGGMVRWNSEEKTWDCPCHGSRFSARGKVLNGPARNDLAAAQPLQGERNPAVMEPGLQNPVAPAPMV